MASSWRAFDSNVRTKPVLNNTRRKEFRNSKIKGNAWNVVVVHVGASGRHVLRCSVLCLCCLLYDTFEHRKK